jgi:hypothetical protein
MKLAHPFLVLEDGLCFNHVLLSIFHLLKSWTFGRIFLNSFSQV